MKRHSFELKLLGGLAALLLQTAAWAQTEPPPLPPSEPTEPAAAAPAQAAEEPTDDADDEVDESAQPGHLPPRRSEAVLPTYAPPPTFTNDYTPPVPKRYEQRDIGVEMGFRGVIVTHDGFDPYASTDVLPSLAVTGTYLPLKSGAFSFGAALEYDIGSRSAITRGQELMLTTHRMSLGVVARVALARRLDVYAKVAPSAMFLRGDIADYAIDRPLVSNAWTWNVDTTAGAALMMASAGDPEMPAVRFWLDGEVGYAFAGAAQMRFAPADDDEDPRQFGSIDLPDLRLGGFTNRIALALTF